MDSLTAAQAYSVQKALLSINPNRHNPFSVWNRILLLIQADAVLSLYKPKSFLLIQIHGFLKHLSPSQSPLPGISGISQQL